MEKEEIEQDDEINEGAEYSAKSEFSKPKIVYSSMEKCIEARGKEMMSGFWNTKLTKDGMPIKVWVSDTRQIFIGSVIALKSILSPEIKQEKSIKKKIDSYEKKIKEAKDKYSYEEQTKELKDKRIVWKNTGKKYIPEIGSLVVIQDINRLGFANEIRGAWDSKVNTYWDIILEQYDLMFACLNDLINKLNYFKQKVSY